MSKTGLIISREYLSRVQKKSFVIMTILGPLLFAALMILPAWLASRDSTEIRQIEVIDESGLLTDAFEDTETLKFTVSDRSLADAKEAIATEELFGVVHIPAITLDNPDGISLITEKSAGIEVTNRIERRIEKAIEEQKISRSQLDKATIDALNANVSLRELTLSEDGEERDANTGLFTIIGYLSSFLIYLFIFIYGAQIMRGVLEEKTNRIIEVIISSVKPFQLMIGKIVGVALVGLTQFALWIILTTAVYAIVMQVVGLDAETMAQAQSMQGAADLTKSQEALVGITNALGSLNIPLLLISFLFYFLGGYLLYGALFAAVGAASDSETDTQQFMLPVSLPLIASIVLLAVVLKDPHGPVAFWMSMIPLSSPVVMMMRIPFGVSIWEVALSMAILVLGFLAIVWLAARIYRVGILMHGTKVNYRTLAKWARMKN